MAAILDEGVRNVTDALKRGGTLAAAPPQPHQRSPTTAALPPQPYRRSTCTCRHMHMPNAHTCLPAGLWESTLLIFVSDNGGPTNGAEGTASNNYPMRGGKNTLVRVWVRVRVRVRVS